MTQDERDSRAADEARARAAVRGLSMPDADPAFRARLRDDFMSGGLVARNMKRRAWGARVPLRLAMAAAVGAVLFWALAVANRGPEWRVLGSRGEGMVLVAGRAVPLDRPADLSRLLRRGVRLRVPENCELDLVCEGRMVVQLTAGTEMTLPGSPGRWVGRAVRAQLESGEVRILTGPEFTGARLTVWTREVRTLVHGTTLAIIRDATSTCVCAFEGEVEVVEPGGRRDTVPIGKRRFVYADGRPPTVADIDAMEQAKLQMFHDAHAAAPRAPRP